MVGLFIPLSALMSLQKSQKVLTQTIARDLTLLTRDTMDQVERAVWNRLEQIDLYAKNLAENPALVTSNAAFERKPDYRSFLAESDRQWQAQDPNDPNSIINQVLDRRLCEQLIVNIKQTFYYTQSYGYDIFKQVTVTNRFGAVIGETSHNRQCDLSRYAWWQQAKEQGLYVGPFNRQTNSIDMAIPILDVANNFVGIIQCSLNTQEFKDILIHLAQNSAYSTTCFTLLSQEHKVLHATDNRHWTCISMATHKHHDILATQQKALWFLVKNPGGRSKPSAMITHVHSNGYRTYQGQQWSLCMSVDADEALYPVVALRKALLLPFSVLFMSTIAAALMFTYSVLRPIEKLSQTANAIRKGNLTVRTHITSHNEIGHLAESFDRMTGELQQTIESLNKQVEERQRAEEGMTKLAGNLVESVQELEKANQEIRQITYAAAHDLKTPLRGMSMISQWILEDHGHLLDLDAQEQIKQLSYRADRFDKLLDGLREYSSLPSEDDTVKLIKLTEHLNTMITRHYDKYLPYIMIPENLPEIYSPVKAIKTVFEKLIDNAIRHMDKEAPVLQIRCHAHLHGWTFYVSDNGPGIEEKYHKKIFGLFQRLSQDDTLKTTGMGLCIAKKIVEAFGGRIWVESEINVGTTFAFTWPKAPRNISTLERLSVPLNLI